MLRKQIFNLDKIQKQIQDAGTLDEQAREASSIRPVIENHLSESEQNASALVMSSREEGERRNIQCVRDGQPFTLQSEHHHAFVLRLGAWVTIMFDVAISGILATTWINLVWWQAGITGALVAAIFSLMCKAGLWACVYNSEKPRPTRRRLQWISSISFVACFVCIATILAMRNPTESWLEYIMALTGFSLGVLGVLMPILAGALLALAYDLDWSYRYEQRYRALRREVAATTGFLDWLNALHQRVPRTFLLLISAFAMSPLLCDVSYAAQEQVLEIWVDDSPSILRAERENGINNLYRQLPGLIIKQSLKQIRVMHFSHAPWESRPSRFDLPQLSSSPCQSNEPKGENRIFKPAAEQLRRKAEAACDAQRKQEQHVYDARLSAVLANVEQALLTLQQEHGQCTALYDLFGRLVTSSNAKLTIIVTDAAETCRKKPALLATAPTGNQVMVLLVAEKNHPHGLDEFRRKKARLSRFVPWAKVEPLFSERLCEVF
jgi:uncharacterized integral membrane protein